jgi:beta-lactamase class A
VLAVGSAFKLAVLAALQQRINAGQLSWTQQVTLRAQDKSLPSGVLQTRPNGSRYTVADLARYMISISDNTAADLLIHLVGRAAIAPFIPERDRPILTTRELFVLKDPANKGLRERYLAAASPAARLAILAQVDQLPLPSLRVLVPLFAKGPVAPRIEYFFSVRRLCGLMARLQRLPQMSINPGVANPAEWTHVAFKGGSEPGVLNLTTMATARNGVTYCVSATWNNTALLDEGRFEALYSSVLHSLSH